MKASRAYTPVQHVFGLAADLTPWPEKSRIRQQHATAASSQGVQQNPGSSLVAASQSNHFAYTLKHEFASSNSMGRWACCEQVGHNLFGGEGRNSHFAGVAIVHSMVSDVYTKPNALG